MHSNNTYANNIWSAVQIIQLLVYSTPVSSSLIGPNIFISTLFSYNLSLRSSLKVRDQVSHPYKKKKTGKIEFCAFQSFSFLDTMLEPS